MAGFLGRFTQQTAEVLDYDVDYTEWFSNRTDAPASFVVIADTGLTVSGSRAGNVVRVTVQGGTNGGRYKVTVRLTTTAGFVKEVDFQVRIKDV